MCGWTVEQRDKNVGDKGEQIRSKEVNPEQEGT